MVCVLVMLWMVVIEPCLIPKDSCITFTIGAKQFVVHDAAVTISCRAGSYLSSFTPYTILSAGSGHGSETTIFLMP